MLINSHLFLIFFFPLFLLAYLLLRKSIVARDIVIILFSIAFYASFYIPYIPLLFGVLLIDFFLAKYMMSLTHKNARRVILWLGILFSLTMLVYFKYTDFLLHTFGTIFGSLGIFSFVNIPKLMPVGISFFTFQRISYLVDCYLGRIQPSNNIRTYFVYSSFFPQLIAGPIVRFGEIERQLYHRIIGWNEIFSGLKYVSLGLVSKSIIADSLFLLEQNLSTHLSILTTYSAIILLFCFSIRIYFDFLGYSLIAIGLAKFVGFDFPSNFASPYLATSLRDFWRRWNMSLSSWMRDYVYIPLGGNRTSKIRSSMNVIITMMLAGIWHGANWSMFFWGLIHGVGLVIERSIRIPFKSNPVSIFFSRVFTCLFIFIAWLPFKLTTLEELRLFLDSISRNSWQWYQAQSYSYLINSLPFILIAIIWIIFGREEKIEKIKPDAIWTIAFILLFIFGLGFSLLNQGIPFIYYQF